VSAAIPVRFRFCQKLASYLLFDPGESVAIVLALVGAKPVKEGTGRIVRYDLAPLEELGRPRIDVLASLSGIFR
jgi:cobalamin biosynthesis Mg chelatase CobN